MMSPFTMIGVVATLAALPLEASDTVAYWPFGSQGGRDASECGYDLKVSGNVKFADGAIRFDGQDAVCSTVLPVDLRQYVKGLTVEFFMRVPNDARNGTMMVLEFTENSSSPQNAGAFYVDIDETPQSKLRGQMKTKSGHHIDDCTGISLNDASWHHVALVLDFSGKGDDLCRLYLDGVQQPQNRTHSRTDFVPLGRARLFIGSRADTKYRFVGELDDIRISGAPLSPAGFLKCRTTEDGMPAPVSARDAFMPRQGRRPPERAKLIPLPFGSITARGWMKTMLERSRDGMGGHFGEFDPDQFEKPYATRDYDATIPGSRGENPGWCAEMAGEYRLGHIMLAGTLDDRMLLERFASWRDAAMALQDAEDGYLGAYRKSHNRHEDYNAWGCHFVYRALLLDYERTGDRRILDAVHRGLLWFVREWAGGRKTNYAGPTIIWPMAEVYRLTGDARLLAFCEDYAERLNAHPSWKPHTINFGFVNMTGSFDEFSLEEGAYHLVAYAVRAQLPGILSLANGVDEMKKRSQRAFDRLYRRVGWQATWAPCTQWEHTGPVGCVRVTEYCNFLNWMEYMQWLARMTGESRFGDLIERMTFNAAMGARKKDERAIAYDSSPNQFVATTTSDQGGCQKYYEAYTPCLFAGCCPAQSIRLVPSYLAMSVMKTATGDVAVNKYGPCHVDVHGLVLDLDTQYPFEDSVRIKVEARESWKGSLRLRCPSWAKSCTVMKNGKEAPTTCESGWIVVKGPWNKDEVVISFVNVPRVRPVRELDQEEPLRTVEYGPLVFSQALKEKWTVAKQDWRSRPLPEGWDWYDVTCAEKPVIYALPPSTIYNANVVRVKRVSCTGYPWENPPLRLEVPMVRAPQAYAPDQEKAQHNVPPRNPVAVEKIDELEMVELVPFGSTNLRLTCFPTAVKVL